MRAKLPEVRRALTGRTQPHDLVLIDQILQHIDVLEAAIVHVQAEIEHCLPRVEEALELVQSIPGIRAVAVAATWPRSASTRAVFRLRVTWFRGLE